MSTNFVFQYAKALFDLGGNLEAKTKYLKELRVVAEALEDTSIKNFLNTKQFTVEQKVQTIDKVLSKVNVSKDVLNTVKILCERNKAGYLDKITLAYEALNDEANGVIRGVVKSSHALKPEQRSSIEAKIESVLKKKVILSYQEDPKVIGGLKAQVGSYTFDDTFETHLKKLKDQMNRSAN